MMRLMRVVAIAALLFPVAAGAQNRADFSGTWQMDTSRSQSAQAGHGASPVQAATVVINQTPDNLVVETIRDGNRLVTRFPAGTNPERPVGTSGRAGAGVGTIMAWEHSELTTSTPIQINGMAVQTIEKRALSADGREMTVMTSISVEHGYSGKGINRSAPLTDVYVRATK
jgi:hypothetical protein